MNENSRSAVVDRLEGRVAVLVEIPSGAVVNVDRGELPPGTVEGAVLTAPISTDGPRWRMAVIDESARKELLDQAREVLRRLRRRDPGGDIVL